MLQKHDLQKGNQGFVEKLFIEKLVMVDINKSNFFM